MKITMNEKHLSRVCEETTYEDGLREGKRLIMTANVGSYRGRCIGLAHNQIGGTKRVYIVKDGIKFKIYINPSITERLGDSFDNEEGCMSYRKGNTVKRHEGVLVRHLTEEGYITEEFHGSLAIIHQHENDHLNGLDIHHQPRRA